MQKDKKSFFTGSLKSLKSYDMFGHLITLNFNLKGNRHKTLLGACFSIFIKFFIWVYIFLTFKTMFEKEANSNSAFASSKMLYRWPRPVLRNKSTVFADRNLPLAFETDLLSLVLLRCSLTQGRTSFSCCCSARTNDFFLLLEIRYAAFTGFFFGVGFRRYSEPCASSEDSLNLDRALVDVNLESLIFLPYMEDDGERLQASWFSLVNWSMVMVCTEPPRRLAPFRRPPPLFFFFCLSFSSPAAMERS